MLSKNSKAYDIIIVGSGFSGLSTAYHLTKASPYKIAVISDPRSKSLSSSFCQMTLGGYFDNFTRISHQWGVQTAETTWKFSHKSYNYCHNLAKRLGVPSQKGKRLRFVVTPDEQKEVQKACHLLKKSDFFCEYKEKKNLNSTHLGEKILATQDEGQLGGWIDNKILMTTLIENIENQTETIEQKITAIKNTSQSIAVKLADGSLLKSEMLVLCCHHSIGDLIPSLKDALVSYQDESHLLSFDPLKKMPNFCGLTFSSFHGHIWGCFLKNNLIQIGGARFLRKYAGIGFNTSELSVKVKNFLSQEVSNLFTFVRNVKVEQSTHGLEIRPCDETPIIGPMFGDDRILLATGFMGQGLSLGLYAGKCLTDLVLNGQCEDLPQFLWPNRLRTL